MSNQEAIALLRNLEDSLDSYCELSEEGKTAFRMAIEALNSSEFPNNSDAISRQLAIDALRKMQTYKMFCSDDMLLIDQAGAQTELMLLPPAEPKRGRWVLVCDNNGMHFICNKCGAWRYHQEQKFCGECGADMRQKGENNESN